MESTTYRSEKNRLLVTDLPLEEASKIAGDLWSNDRVRQIAKELSAPLDEYVRVFVGITGQAAVNKDQFVELIGNAIALRKELERDQPLIKSYQELERVHHATPILAIEEITRLILMAVISGAASGIGKTLVEQFLSRQKEKRADVLVQLLMSSPIPSLLAEYESGLSIKEIAEEAGMTEADVGYFLAKYEERGWVSKKRKGLREVWRFRKRKIIGDFKS